MDRVAIVLLAIVAGAGCKKERPQPAGDPVAAPSPKVPDPPRVSPADLDTVVAKVCTRLLECSGLGPNPPADKVGECLANSRRLAVDDFSRGILYEANQAVITACQAKPCEAYADCYMDTLKAEETRQLGGETAPKVEVSPEMRKRFVTLVCDVATENAGRVPDLATPNPSPKVKELNGLIGEIGSAGTVADLMKDAIKECAR